MDGRAVSIREACRERTNLVDVAAPYGTHRDNHLAPKRSGAASLNPGSELGQDFVTTGTTEFHALFGQSSLKGMRAAECEGSEIILP